MDLAHSCSCAPCVHGSCVPHVEVLCQLPCSQLLRGAAVAVHCPGLHAGVTPLHWFCHLAQALSFLGACAAVVVPVASKTAMVKAWAHSAAELALSRLGIAAVGVAMTLKLLTDLLMAHWGSLSRWLHASMWPVLSLSHDTWILL